MSLETVKEIIGKAVTDTEFRALLESDPDKALKGYELTGEERASLEGLTADKFDAVASDLGERVSRASFGNLFADFLNLGGDANLAHDAKHEDSDLLDQKVLPEGSDGGGGAPADGVTEGIFKFEFDASSKDPGQVGEGAGAEGDIAGAVIPVTDVDPEGADGLLLPAVQKAVPEGEGADGIIRPAEFSDGGGGAPVVEDGIIRPASGSGVVDPDLNIAEGVEGIDFSDVKADDLVGEGEGNIAGAIMPIMDVSDQLMARLDGIVGPAMLDGLIGTNGIVGPAMLNDSDGNVQGLIMPIMDEALKEVGGEGLLEQINGGDVTGIIMPIESEALGQVVVEGTDVEGIIGPISIKDANDVNELIGPMFNDGAGEVNAIVSPSMIIGEDGASSAGIIVVGGSEPLQDVNVEHLNAQVNDGNVVGIVMPLDSEAADAIVGPAMDVQGVEGSTPTLVEGGGEIAEAGIDRDGIAGSQEEEDFQTGLQANIDRDGIAGLEEEEDLGPAFIQANVGGAQGTSPPPDGGGEVNPGVPDDGGTFEGAQGSTPPPDGGDGGGGEALDIPEDINNVDGGAGDLSGVIIEDTPVDDIADALSGPGPKPPAP